MLDANRAELIAWFRREQEEAEAKEAARRHEAAEREARHQEATAAQTDLAARIEAAFQDPRVATRPAPPLPARPVVPMRAPEYSPREPIHDARYMRIRAAKVKRWQAQGIDLTRMHHFQSLVANCLTDYERGLDVRE